MEGRQGWPGFSDGAGLQNKADEPAAPLVDDALTGFLELEPCICRQAAELVVEPLIHQLVEGLAKDVGGPDVGGVLLKVCPLYTSRCV